MQIDTGNLAIAESISKGGAKPKNWKVLGSGISRTAYLAPDGLVYKIPHGGVDVFDQCKTEYAAVWRRRKMTNNPEWLIIPRAFLHVQSGVIVMEYVAGDAPTCNLYGVCHCFGECLKVKIEKLRDLGYTDLHGGNIIVTPECKIALVDFGTDRG